MNAETLAGLMPLAPPPAPAVDPTAWVVAGLLLALGLLALWIAAARPARKRLRRLRHIEQRLTVPAADIDALAGETDQLLQAFGPPGPLSATRPPQSVDADHWQALVESLHAARFGAGPADATHLSADLQVVRQQLEQARG